MKVIHETQRDWIPLEDSKKIEYLVGQKLARTLFYLKHSDPPAEFQPAGKKGHNLLFHCSPHLEPTDRITLYTTVNRQIELDFEVIDFSPQGEIQLRPVSARIGQSFRKGPRIPVDGDVYARNFQIVKEDEIAVDRSRIAYEIVFKEYLEKAAFYFPNAKLFGDADQDRPEESKIVERMAQTLFIVDTQKMEAYRSSGQGFLDYYSILSAGVHLQETLDSFKSRGVESFACIPIIYHMASGKNRVLATLVLEGKGENRVTSEVLEKMNQVVSGLADRLINVNAFHVDKKQTLINVSENGAAILCEDELLLKYLPTVRNVTFDLVFSKQSPIRLQAGVRHIRQKNGHMVVGFQFDGSGQQSGQIRSGMERLKSMIKTLIKAKN